MYLLCLTSLMTVPVEWSVNSWLLPRPFMVSPFSSQVTPPPHHILRPHRAAAASAQALLGQLNLKSPLLRMLLLTAHLTGLCLLAFLNVSVLLATYLPLSSLSSKCSKGRGPLLVSASGHSRVPAPGVFNRYLMN